MPSTSDTNLAAYLITIGHEITYSIDEPGAGKRRVCFHFDLTPAQYKEITTTYLNSEVQRFVEAQSRLKNLIRNMLS